MAEARKFISDLLIEHMEESDWVSFTIEVYESLDEECSNFSSLVANLTILPIPMSETLEYAAGIIVGTGE